MSLPPLDRRPGGTRRLAALAALTVLAAIVVSPQPAAAAPAAACPTTGAPFTSQLSNGTVKIGNLDPATGASATACGLVAFQPGGTVQATIARDNLTFAPLSVPVGLLDVTVQIVPVSDFSGPVTFTPDGIHIALSGDVVANAAILLGTCVIGPFRSTLTTDTSGSLTGTPFIGPSPAELAGRLVGNEDAVPAVKASFGCPLLVALLLNGISGLPSPAGESSITFDATLNLSPAAAQLRTR